MRNLMLLIAAGLPLLCPAQANDNKDITLTLAVTASDHKSIPGINVTLIDKASGEKTSNTTDDKGKAIFTVHAGNSYAVGIKDKENYREIKIPSSAPSNFRLSMVYSESGPEVKDPFADKIPAPKNIPKLVNADTIRQQGKPGEMKLGNDGIITIIVLDAQRKVLPNLPVHLTCAALNRVYAGTTDKNGEASFQVTVGNKYDVSIERQDAFSQIDLPNEKGIIMERKIVYMPTRVTEKVKQDTVRQTLQQHEPGSTHAYVHILVQDLDSKPLADEPIAMDVEGSKKVYFAMTNKDGIVEFLLPKGNKYMLNFKYERGVDMFNISAGKGLRTINIQYSYMGSKKIEEFYKKAERDKEGFLTEFMEGKVKPAPPPTLWLQKTPNGYYLHFPDSSPSNTPVVVNDKLFMSGGFYTNEFYGIDSKTGKAAWSLQLSEGGASPAVYENGVILVNTESCTLYAIDAVTGKLLWSHWLSNYLFTSPAVANGKVYAIYGNDLGQPDQRKHVLACFDLRTGKALWQQWVDHEGLGSPVVAGGNVYLTSVDGKLYMFNAVNGSNGKNVSINATSAPSIIGDKIYISRKSASDKETVCIYKAGDLSFVTELSALQGAAPRLDGIDMMRDMNFTGSRIIEYNGKHYNIIGSKLNCSDPDGKIIWSVAVGNQPAGSFISAPVVVSGKVVIATPAGDVNLYDAENGKLLKSYHEKATFWTQPTVVNGKIYASTMEGKLVNIDTGDPSLTGWSMWNGNGSHNTSSKKD